MNSRTTQLCFRIALLLLAIPQMLNAQKIGLVLSGGGAKGFAHIGVIQALEEHKIPIDYITGTSIGALIGSMYAMGLSIAEIEAMIANPAFNESAKGLIDDDYKYYFSTYPKDASWVSLKMAYDSIIHTRIPGGLVSSAPTIFTLLERQSQFIAYANYDFDHLMIPFRCVAGDIVSKEQVVFSEGDLSFAVRASMAYPFYYAPVPYKDMLLYDGGIYNNFPVDVMEDEFNPDIIIGVNAGSDPEIPTEDNLLSQVKTMLIQTTKYQMPRPLDILIEPEVKNLGTFDFQKYKQAIDAGYREAIKSIPDLRKITHRSYSADSLNSVRLQIRENLTPILIDKIIVNGLNFEQATYVRKLLNPGKKKLSLNELKPAFFKLATDENFKSVSVQLQNNKVTGYYDLIVDVRRDNDLKLDFGGNIASRPINQAFAGLQYNFLGKQSLSVRANSYFGKLYTSASAMLRLKMPGRFPLHIEPGFVLNRFDYFKSSTTFFEDVKPPFLVQRENQYFLDFAIPLGNKAQVSLGGSYFKNNDSYYQTNDFALTDSTDETTFEGIKIALTLERSTLNRKLYANSGTYFAIKARHYKGAENTVLGTTALVREETNADHEWLSLKVIYDNYFKRSGPFKFGFYSELQFSNQPFFANYTATVLSSPSFQPIHESATRFLERFRTHNSAGAGLKVVTTIVKRFDMRLEGYVLQPFQEIQRGANILKPVYGESFDKRYFSGTANLVYNSPAGPISLSANYYHDSDEPISVLFHIGYIIFNRRTYD